MIRPIALLLTVLTGFSGLVYQVTWQKCLATLLGSHSEATAAVLGIFLGGLSVGYSLFGRITRRFVEQAEAEGRPPRLLLLYGVVEAGIGLWALAFLPLLQVVQALSLTLPDTAPGLGFAIDVLLTVLLIGPPTVCMGGTIPILTQALARSLDDATRVHAWIYAFNTGGAFVGALSAGFVLVPVLGLQGVLHAMGVVNLAAGAVFLVLGLRARGGTALPAEEGEARIEGFALYGLVAMLLGFAMMSIQTVLIRLGGLSFGASHFTFAMVVSVYVLCLAIGGFAVSLLPRIRPIHLVASTWLLGASFLLLYLPLDDAPYYAHTLRVLFRDSEAGFYPYYLSAFVGVLFAIGIPVILSGASLPLLFDHLRGQVGDLGAIAGRLYSLNTLGNLLGALLGGYALLFWVDLDDVYRLGVLSVGISAALLTVRLYGLPTLGAAALLVPVGLALVQLE
ncbi:MAG: fused MFS/spermidine synthase [Myxococcota bacterium]|nr:fused MFS/spermidine synthase [Myxococcota bacterium]